MQIVVLYFFLILFMSGKLFGELTWNPCEGVQDIYSFQEKELETPRYVVLLAPGLNFNPGAFRDIVEELQKEGAEIYGLCLATTSSYTYKESNPDKLVQLWKEQMKQAVHKVRERLEEKPEAKSILIGYSLGGLLTEWYLQSTQESAPDFTIYFAPAVRLNSWNVLFLELADFLPNSWRLPSFNLEAYRSKTYSYIGEYTATLELYKEYQSLQKQKLKSKTLVVLTKSDELVAGDMLEEELLGSREQALYILDTSTTKSGVGKHHLLIDRKSLGEISWNLLLEKWMEMGL